MSGMIFEEFEVSRVRMLEELPGAGGGIGGGANAGSGSEDTPEAVFRQATQAAKKRLMDSLLGARG